ncbi:4Fe-4S binding protein [Kitasatospora sp. NPDC101183]|uniref:4Fe-4S binding protein n=1 Tax=Kitasatospora sp. NPDC101183 TaxID=3364100 RepID=UPI003827F5D8
MPPAPAGPTDAAITITTELVRAIPDAVHGSFVFTEEHLALVPEGTTETLRPYLGWSVFCYAVPITDEGLWVWHHHGEYRSLLANYVLLRAATAIRRELDRAGIATEDLPELTAQGVSMVEVGEYAGIGNRGWNNLLLHPDHGSWLQIHALLVDAPLAESPLLLSDVCVKCGNCLRSCPVDALEEDAFHRSRCQQVVAAPWDPRSRAEALTDKTYIECRMCIDDCPIGNPVERLLAWKR